MNVHMYVEAHHPHRGGGSASVLEIAELLRAVNTCDILGDFPILGMLFLLV